MMMMTADFIKKIFFALTGCLTKLENPVHLTNYQMCPGYDTKLHAVVRLLFIASFTLIKSGSICLGLT